MKIKANLTKSFVQVSKNKHLLVLLSRQWSLTFYNNNSDNNVSAEICCVTLNLYGMKKLRVKLKLGVGFHKVFVPFRLAAPLSSRKKTKPRIS